VVSSDSSDWKRVSQLVADALERPADERAAFLESACASDARLRREVESLLAADAHAGSFLQRSAIDSTAAADIVTAAARESTGLVAGRRIGPYEIIRELGHGGMGVVYLAARADRAFDKQVAVKVVHAVGASELALQRFHEERRILASLDHPNIARLLDGGVTPDGVSYLVMEYVDGVPLDVYCADRQLPLSARVRVFREVADAVHYAHRRLIIHRDIKPRNILVTAEGTPKLLDFGIAKLIDANPSADHTRTQMRAFTLESASPEQIRGEPMTVASDVYSLGVLLYQLICGQRPCGVAAATDTQLMRAICEDPPERPSQIARGTTRLSVSAELEWIVLAALRKEPERRYASVEQFIADLDRLAAGRPVVAGPDSRRYRARKFISRHRTGVVATVLLAASLAAGVTATLWQARRAQQRFDDVRQLAHTFIFDIHDAVEKLPGSTTARQLLVTHALTYLDRLAADAGSDASLQRELAASYEKLADVLGQPNTANLGDLTSAIATYRKAQAARERLLAAGDNVEVRRDLSTTSMKLARALIDAGDNAAGLEEARKASRIEEALTRADASAGARLRLGAAYTAEGTLLTAAGQTREAVERMRQAIAILEPLQSDTAAQLQLALTLSDFGRTLCEGTPVEGLVPDPKGCIEMHQRSNAIEERLARADASNLKLQRSAFVGAILVGGGLVMLGDHQAAIVYFRRACLAGESLAALDAANLQALSDAAVACERLGSSLAQTGQELEALPLLERSAANLRRVLASDPKNLATRARIADVNVGVGLAHAARGGRASLSRPDRVGHWRNAKASFQSAHAFWTEMRDTGVTGAGERDRPLEIAREIAKCDEALAQLR
jgi:non-specific serine/threonine protein kinase/serine/threonine-protein kinase